MPKNNLRLLFKEILSWMYNKNAYYYVDNKGSK